MELRVIDENRFVSRRAVAVHALGSDTTTDAERQYLCRVDYEFIQVASDQPFVSAFRGREVVVQSVRVKSFSALACSHRSLPKRERRSSGHPPFMPELGPWLLSALMERQLKRRRTRRR